MRYIRQVVVVDAADIDAEGAFWAGMFEGRVVADDDFHCVVDRAGHWIIGVQRAPDHVPPEWPDGNSQQVHVDLHDTSEGHHVYADPAGHPFCIGWGQPDEAALAAFLERLPPISQ